MKKFYVIAYLWGVQSGEEWYGRYDTFDFALEKVQEIERAKGINDNDPIEENYTILEVDSETLHAEKVWGAAYTYIRSEYVRKRDDEQGYMYRPMGL